MPHPHFCLCTSLFIFFFLLSPLPVRTTFLILILSFLPDWNHQHGGGTRELIQSEERNQLSQHILQEALVRSIQHHGCRSRHLGTNVHLTEMSVIDRMNLVAEAMGSPSTVTPGKQAEAINHERGMAAPSLCPKFALNNDTLATRDHQYSTPCAKWFHMCGSLFSQTFYSDIYFTTKYQRLISLQSLHYVDMIFPSRKYTHKPIIKWKRKTLSPHTQLSRLPEELSSPQLLA